MSGSWMMAQPRARRCFQPPLEVAGQGLLPADQAGHAGGPTSFRSRSPLRGKAADAAVEIDVLAHGQVVVESELLGHVADDPLDVLALAGDVEAADERLARGRPEDAAEHPDGRGLARPVRAEEAEDLAAADAEGDVVDGGEFAERLGQAADVDAGPPSPLMPRRRSASERNTSSNDGAMLEPAEGDPGRSQPLADPVDPDDRGIVDDMQALAEAVDAR